LRTPLQVIQISADKLLRSTDPIEQKKLGRFMHDAVNEMSQMLSDLLDTVRTQLGGSLPLQPLDVDTSAICQEAIEQFRIIHPRRELLCSVHSHLWGRWDAIRIRQLLNNLLRNALQHGSPGTPVTLTAKLEGDSAVLTVHNEGDPISPQLLANIFEPLRRGDAQREAPNSFSMGLGLYIVATITEAHRGEIQVTSTLDQGTTFRVTLPLASERCAS
jgi:signal transduction histidine kinase